MFGGTLKSRETVLEILEDVKFATMLAIVRASNGKIESFGFWIVLEQMVADGYIKFAENGARKIYFIPPSSGDE